MKVITLGVVLALAKKSNASNNDAGAPPGSRQLNAAVPTGVPVYLNFRNWNQIISAPASCNDNEQTINGGEGNGGDQNNSKQHWRILSDGKIESVGCPGKYFSIRNNECADGRGTALRSNQKHPTQLWSIHTHPSNTDWVYIKNNCGGDYVLGKNGYHNSVMYTFNPDGGSQQMTANAVPGYTPAPTSYPTKSPTDATEAPTAVPTTTPWGIQFVSMASDFSANSTDELVLEYKVGNTRDYQHMFYAGQCNATAASNTDITGFQPNEYNVTDSEGSIEDGMMAFTIKHSFDKSKITGSNIWSNETANATKIELCQVVQLYLTNGDKKMIITEDIRDIVVNMDMGVDFEVVGNVNLAGATINAEQQNTTLADSITAFKCLELGGDEDGSALAPNAELSVCIESVSEDVVIDEIVSMKIDGKSPANVDSTLRVMEDGDPVFSSFTTFSYAADSGAIVTTRIPINMFNFEATDANIVVSGALTLKLADGTRRRLAINKPSRALEAAVEADNEAGFDLTINLQPETDAGDNLGSMMNSAKAAASKGLAVLVAVASACAFW